MVFLLLGAIFFLLPAATLKQSARPTGGGSQGEQGQNGSKSDPSFNDQSKNGAPKPFAVVILRDEYNPPMGTYYFRETAFSHFNGNRLVRDSSGAFDRDLSSTFPSGTTELKTDVRPGRPLRTTVALLVNDARPLSLVNAFRLTAVANPDPRRFHRAYDVESYVLRDKWKDLLMKDVGNPDWPDAQRRHYLAAPEDPRYRELANTMVTILRPDLASQPVAKALAVVEWLSKNGVYSLKTAHAASETPVADFLFGDRTGYCVHFAHAAVYLFRSLGVPSRVATGYAVEARRRGHGSSILINDQDSHAWPEIYVRGYGWVVADITPEKTLDPPPPPVDSGLQQMMGDMARQSPLNGEDLRPDEQKQKDPVNSLRWYAPIALAILLGILYAIKAWRKFEIRICAESRLPRVAYRALLDDLAEFGRRRLYGETRESFARRNLALCPALANLTWLHLRATIGQRPAPSDRGGYLALRREAIAQLSAANPRWRRALGLLNPVSWWRVR